MYHVKKLNAFPPRSFCRNIHINIKVTQRNFASIKEINLLLFAKLIYRGE